MKELSLMSVPLKRILIRRAEVVFDVFMKQPHFRDYDPAKSCLVWAAAVLEASKAFPAMHGMQLQGGSASWRVVAPGEDDGVSATHYSYVYTPPKGDDLWDPVTGIGEVHYWCAVHPKHDPEGHGLIVDLTTKYVRQLALAQGIKVSCGPPPVVWARPDEMPENVAEYKPEMKAVVSGTRLIKELLGVRV